MTKHDKKKKNLIMQVSAEELDAEEILRDDFIDMED